MRLDKYLSYLGLLLIYGRHFWDTSGRHGLEMTDYVSRRTLKARL